MNWMEKWKDMASRQGQELDLATGKKKFEYLLEDKQRHFKGILYQRSQSKSKVNNFSQK